jgi:Rad3-related DNA helicase
VTDPPNNMFVEIVVRGNCWPYRDIFKDTYNLYWNKKRKCYVGKVDIRGRKIKNLQKFCSTFNLKLWVDGQIVTTEPLEEEEDDFIALGKYDDSTLGKLGNKTFGTIKSQNYNKVIVKQADKPLYDADEYFAGTRFDVPRLEQQQVVPLITQALEDGYENIIVECPVGSGKSAMAMVVPKVFDANAYIVTPLKGLQKQYLTEMPFMRSVMGKGNYDCKLDVEPNCRSEPEAIKAVEAHKMKLPMATAGCSADLAPCSNIGFKCSLRLPIQNQQIDWAVESKNLCGYYGALHEAHHNRFFVGNTHYLMGMNQSDAYLKQRDLLIIDEAHTLPHNMADFYAFDLSIKKMEKLLGIPTFNDIMESIDSQAINLQNQRNTMLTPWNPVNSPNTWGMPLIGSITPETDEKRHLMGAKIWILYLGNMVKHITAKIDKKQYDDKTIRYAINSSKHLGTIIEQLENGPKNIIWQYDNEEDPVYLNFKPLDISHLSQNLLLNLGSRRIFMSGTIADADIFMEELGLDPAKTTFIKVDYSSFPIANRPIYTTLQGGNLNRSKRSQEQYILTAEKIIDIAKQFPDQKGLILPYTDEIEKNIVAAIEQLDRSVADRLVQHSKSSRERESVFDNFDKSTGNQILLSTYANQGYDGGTVGFCVIPKVPFPSLGDVRIVKKMKANPDWYKLQTGVMLTQMLGRIVRSPKDKGKVYILDPAFDFHLNQGYQGSTPLNQFIPSYLTDAMDNTTAAGANQMKLY